jgi:hypothetical protein
VAYRGFARLVNGRIIHKCDRFTVVPRKLDERPIHEALNGLAPESTGAATDFPAAVIASGAAITIAIASLKRLIIGGTLPFVSLRRVSAA